MMWKATTNCTEGLEYGFTNPYEIAGYKHSNQQYFLRCGNSNLYRAELARPLFYPWYECTYVDTMERNTAFITLQNRRFLQSILVTAVCLSVCLRVCLFVRP